MANIEDWYGRNSIGWGDTYDNSWWGNVNETNNWVIIYPFNAEGSLLLADTNLINADTTIYKADATEY